MTNQNIASKLSLAYNHITTHSVYVACHSHMRKLWKQSATSTNSASILSNQVSNNWQFVSHWVQNKVPNCPFQRYIWNKLKRGHVAPSVYNTQARDKGVYSTRKGCLMHTARGRNVSKGVCPCRRRKKKGTRGPRACVKVYYFRTGSSKYIESLSLGLTR